MLFFYPISNFLLLLFCSIIPALFLLSLSISFNELLTQHPRKRSLQIIHSTSKHQAKQLICGAVCDVAHHTMERLWGTNEVSISSLILKWSCILHESANVLMRSCFLQWIEKGGGGSGGMRRDGCICQFALGDKLLNSAVRMIAVHF